MWPHILREGPAGIAALLTYLATAPLIKMTDLPSSHYDFQTGKFVVTGNVSSHYVTAFDGKPLSQAGAVLATAAAFGVVFVVAHFLQHLFKHTAA